MKYILSLILALIIVLLVVNFVSEGMLDEAGIAARVEGTVLVFTGQAPEGRPVRTNDSIAKNDRVEVAGNSRLELRLPDGSCLRLSENARLTMRKLRFEKRTGTLIVQAFLHNGKLWAKIRKRASPDSWAEVITPTALAAGRETAYEVEAKENASTAINVYEGIVFAVSPTKDPARIPQIGALGEGQQVSLQALQQISVPAKEGILQPMNFDLKAAINDWVRWNLQRDAREGLVSITVAPATPTITRGASLQFAAAAHYPDKTEKDITSFATWSSSGMNIAKIDAFGAAAGTKVGAATIAAAIEDISGSTVLNVSRDIVAIKVTPASRSVANGSIQQFSAVGTFSDRTVKDITSSVVWRSSNPDVAFVDAAGRAVAGKTAGTAVISASLGSKRGSATLRVRRELMSITIMPSTALIAAGETQRFGAVGNYSDGTTEDLTETVEWESSDDSTAEIDQAIEGRVIGKNKAGSATINAAFDGKSGSATITIYTMPSP